MQAAVAGKGSLTPSRLDELDGAPRLVSLDVMRGIAILGILFMNINTMGGSVWALFAFDVRHLGWAPADRIAWAVRDIIADGTARCMLELLFGAGMAILTARLAEAGESYWLVWRRYGWRNVVLFLFGLAHLVLLLWGGDILHTYAVAAIVVALFRGLDPRWLLGMGLAMIAFVTVQNGVGYYEAVTARAEAATIRTRIAARQPVTITERAALAAVDKRMAERKGKRERDARRIAEEDRARTGSAADWVAWTWRTEATILGKGYELMSIWEAASVMLIGTALCGWGILQGHRSRRFYALWTVAFYAAGIAIRATGTRDAFRFDDAPSIIWPLYEVGRLTTTLGHLGAIHLLLGTVLGARLLRPFEAAGRTALSIYILQTLICLWVLYPPWGFHLYGRQGWMALMLTAAAVNLGLLLLANWWVVHYRIAPVEWAWRSVVEGRRLPFRRGAPLPEGAPIVA